MYMKVFRLLIKYLTIYLTILLFKYVIPLYRQFERSKKLKQSTYTYIERDTI